jgi:hypothetical protein
MSIFVSAQNAKQWALKRMADRLGRSDVVSVGNLPLMMGDKIVGRAEINYETNELKADIDPKLIELLVEGLGNGLLQISFSGLPGYPMKVEDVQRKFKEYIDG